MCQGSVKRTLHRVVVVKGPSGPVLRFCCSWPAAEERHEVTVIFIRNQECSSMKAQDNKIWMSPDPSTCHACHPLRMAGTARCTCTPLPPPITPCTHMWACSTTSSRTTAWPPSQHLGDRVSDHPAITVNAGNRGHSPLVIPEVAVLLSLRVCARLEVVALHILQAPQHTIVPVVTQAQRQALA